MSKKFSKFLAAMLATMMVLSPVGMVGADDGEEYYSGSITIQNGKLMSPAEKPEQMDDTDGSFTLNSGIDYQRDANRALYVFSYKSGDDNISSITVNGGVKAALELLLLIKAHRMRKSKKE